MVQAQSYVNHSREIYEREPAHHRESLRLDVENIGQASAVVAILPLPEGMLLRQSLNFRPYKEVFDKP